MTTNQTSDRRRRTATVAAALALILVIASMPVSAYATGLIDFEKDSGGKPPHLEDLPEPKDDDRSPPRGIPSAWPDGSHYQPPKTGEIFLPGEYHSLCVPSLEGDGYDHFIVDADSLRILEMVMGDVKLSAHGFVAAECALPWDVPWPTPSSGPGGPPPHSDDESKDAEEEESDEQESDEDSGSKDAEEEESDEQESDEDSGSKDAEEERSKEEESEEDSGSKDSEDGGSDDDESEEDSDSKDGKQRLPLPRIPSAGP